jgi:hypothetical protein
MHHAWAVPVIFLASQLAIPISTSYIDFINDGSDAVIAIELALPDSNNWRLVKLHGVTRGSYVSSTGGYIGHAVVTVDVNRGCFYDVRIEFSQQRALLVKAFDVCHNHALNIDDMWQKAYRLSRMA